jgi:hypothetical protein
MTGQAGELHSRANGKVESAMDETWLPFLGRPTTLDIFQLQSFLLWIYAARTTYDTLIGRND